MCTRCFEEAGYQAHNTMMIDGSYMEFSEVLLHRVCFLTGGTMRNDYCFRWARFDLCQPFAAQTCPIGNPLQ